MWFGVLQVLFCRVLAGTFCSGIILATTPTPALHFLSSSRKVTGQHSWYFTAEGAIIPPSGLEISTTSANPSEGWFRDSQPWHRILEEKKRITINLTARNTPPWSSSFFRSSGQLHVSVAVIGDSMGKTEFQDYLGWLSDGKTSLCSCPFSELVFAHLRKCFSD